jgi:hypothetical protein
MSLIGAELAEMADRRKAALQKGRESSIQRAEFKRKLKQGTIRLSEVLREGLPLWLGSMPAERLLLCAPRVGPAATRSLLLEAHLSPMQEARFITTRQRNLLADELEKIEGLK